MAIVPRIKHTFLRVVVDLCGVGVVVYKRETGNHLSVCVRVERVGNIGMRALETVNGVQNAADDEAVTIVVPPQARPPALLFL